MNQIDGQFDQSRPASQAEPPGLALLVDDEPNVLQSLTRSLRSTPVRIMTADSANAAIQIIESQPVDLIVADEHMPQVSGSDLLAWTAENAPEVVRVMLTGKPSLPIAIEAVNQGEVYRFLTKPVNANELAITILTGIEQKRLRERNRQLMELNQQQLIELEKSNRELESFARVVAHDVKSPLQSIRGYCELVRDVNADRISEDTYGFLSSAIKNVDRMARLVDDLLDYSCAGTNRPSKAVVDLSVILADVAADLDGAIRRTDAVIEVGKLPYIQGNATQLAQLFQNLIANAIKFRGERRPHIVVAAEPTDNGWEVSVADNGIGIAQEDQKRVFEAFERGDGVEDYDGSGLGLATCQKIVEQHHGEIRLESEPGEGTTFYLTFPADEAAPARAPQPALP